MNRERDKAKKICNQIIDVFFEYRVREIGFELRVLENKTIMWMRGNIKNSDMDISKLKNDLKASRALEYDDYYDELLGIGEVDAIKYVSYLIDNVSIHTENDILYIELLRKHVN